MLPGKVYTPEDVLLIARKRFWLLLLPLAVVSAGTAVYVRTLPNVYQSQTLIQVAPQGVPENYVRPTVTTKIEDRLQAMRQVVLSRTRLESIINELNLYREDLRTGTMEDVYLRMRDQHIRIQVLRDRADAFTISYTGEDPKTVKLVTEKLGSLFVDESVRDRSSQATNTSEFIEGTVEDYGRLLKDQEKKVADYRRRNAGRLPEQLESNLQVLENAHQQLSQVGIARIRDEDSKIRLERDIADLEQQIEEIPAPSPDGTPQSTPAQQLESARAELARLKLTGKTDEHFQVLSLMATIRELEARVAALPAQAGDTPVSPDLMRLSPAETRRRKQLDDLRLNLQQVKRNIAAGEAEQERLQKVIAEYEKRNEAIPKTETELLELNREYETISGIYRGMVVNREQSRMSTNLENRQIGERFKVLDPALVPERPISPNRLRLNLMGFAAGLGIAMLLIALLEYRDRSFKTDEDVARVLTLPVLAVVPLMQSEIEKHRAFRNHMVMGVGLGTTVLVCMAVVVYTLVR
jgi:polysaccharide chain length determinant protein (PEP-CTERM system associated)